VLQLSGLPTDESLAIQVERSPPFIADNELPITAHMNSCLGERAEVKKEYQTPSIAGDLFQGLS